MEKKLYRVKEGKMLTGVCTGSAEYFDLDVTLVRLLVAIGSLFLWPIIIAYLVMSFIIPEKPEEEAAAEEVKEEAPVEE